MVNKRELKEFSNNTVSVVQIPQAITEQDINYIVCGWLEDDVSCLIASSKVNGFRDAPEYETMYYSDWITNKILSGGKLIVKDMEDGKTYELTLEKLLNGIKLNATERPHDNYFNDNHDAITYDCIIQYAIFGELVYG